MANMMPARSIVKFAPGGMDLRMGQSAAMHILRGPSGGLPMGLSGLQFDTPLKIDRFDQWAAEQVIAHLRDRSFSIPSYLRPLAEQVRYADGVSPESDELIDDLMAKIGRTVDALPEMSDATKARLKKGLATPAAIHTRVLQIPMDDGSIGTFLAWRIQDNRWDGTDIWTGGGLRESTDMGTSLCRILANGMTVKDILHDLGFGGAKGGIACDPEKLSLREQKRLLTAYSYAFSTAIAMNRDKPAGDIGTTDSRYMDWLQQAMDDVLGSNVAPGSYTGKTHVPGMRPRHNGTPLRGVATGLGNLFGLQALIEGGRAFVMGAGNAGMEFALKALEAGYTIVGINDTRHAWMDQNGLSPDDLHAIKEFKAKKRSLESIRVAAQPSAAMLGLLDQVDVFVPAGKHRSVTDEMVGRLKEGAVICPMANHPFTPDASRVVADRERAGNLRAPHYSVTSGGGVASSSLEARQNIYDEEVSETEEADFIKARMLAALDAVEKVRRDEGVSSEEAALRVGLRRLAQVMPA